MRKLVSFIFLTILLFSLCGCQNPKTTDNEADSTPAESTIEKNKTDDSLTEKLIREIDGAYLKDSILPEYSTTTGMIELADKYTEKWKQIADEYYNKIMEYDGVVQPSENNYSSDDLHTFVSNMNTNWEQYYQMQCENYVKTLQTIYSGGTIVGPIFADYKYEMQKEWALQLVGIYQQLYIEHNTRNW